MRLKTLKCSNFCYLKKKYVSMVKNAKKMLKYATCTRNLINTFNLKFLYFLSQKLDFFQNKQNSKTIKRLMAHLFFQVRFSKSWCWFLAFTKDVKSASHKQFWQEKKFNQIFIFYHPYESLDFCSAGFL